MAALFGISVAAHATLAAALIIAAMWQIDSLLYERELVVFSEITPPAPATAPPPSPAPPPERKRVIDKPTRAPIDDLVQPIDTDEDDAIEIDWSPGEVTADTNARTPGGAGLDPNGIGGPIGVCRTPPCVGDRQPPPPPPVDDEDDEPPISVPLHALGAERIAGNEQIYPPDVVRLAMVRGGEDKLVAMVKMCLDRAGRVASRTLVHSSGHAAYDGRILSEMASWRYTPHRVNGEPVPVCTVITFVYQMQR